jgi:hypothetical protein
MTRGLAPALLVVSAVALVPSQPRAAGESESALPVLQQFLAQDDPTPTSVRGRRHLEARTEHFGGSAWMDVVTEADTNGFKYRVVGEGGSESIRNRVFRALLNTEQKSWGHGGVDGAALTPANYTFDDELEIADGLARLGVQARRKDILLINGALFVKPDDGDLVRMEGQLAKNPSFWTRHVEITRRYRRFGEIRMPVAFESVADVILYGHSSLSMTYHYDSINGQPPR